jgi:hypothetical protein
MGVAHPETITADWVDDYFASHTSKKGEFALALSELVEAQPGSVVLPPHLGEMFDWLLDEPPAGGEHSSAID